VTAAKSVGTSASDLEEKDRDLCWPRLVLPPGESVWVYTVAKMDQADRQADRRLTDALHCYERGQNNIRLHQTHSSLLAEQIPPKFDVSKRCKLTSACLSQDWE